MVARHFEYRARSRYKHDHVSFKSFRTHGEDFQHGQQQQQQQRRKFNEFSFRIGAVNID